MNVIQPYQFKLGQPLQMAQRRARGPVDVAQRYGARLVGQIIEHAPVDLGPAMAQDVAHDAPCGHRQTDGRRLRFDPHPPGRYPFRQALGLGQIRQRKRQARQQSNKLRRRVRRITRCHNFGRWQQRNQSLRCQRLQLLACRAGGRHEFIPGRQRIGRFGQIMEDVGRLAGPTQTGNSGADDRRTGDQFSRPDLLGSHARRIEHGCTTQDAAIDELVSRRRPTLILDSPGNLTATQVTVLAQH